MVWIAIVRASADCARAPNLGNRTAGRRYDGYHEAVMALCPRDLSEGVLSQMGTIIVHRFSNGRDRDVVERACGGIDHAALAFLPTLAPGHAAMLASISLFRFHSSWKGRRAPECEHRHRFDLF
jgi:hypothetical protein